MTLTNPECAHPMDDALKRRSITPEEIEEQIHFYEKRLESASGDEARTLQETIHSLKEVTRMRAGTIKIWQRIPEKITGKP